MASLLLICDRSRRNPAETASPAPATPGPVPMTPAVSPVAPASAAPAVAALVISAGPVTNTGGGRAPSGSAAPFLQAQPAGGWVTRALGPGGRTGRPLNAPVLPGVFPAGLAFLNYACASVVRPTL